MKKIGLLLFILLVSCDNAILITYTIKNNCEDTIFVKITTNQSSQEVVPDFFIKSKGEYLIFSEKGINSVDTWIIKYTFTEIDIYKNGKKSNENYLNENLWKVKSKSDTWNLYLIVNPEDFETE